MKREDFEIKRFYELQDNVFGYYPDANFELLKKAYSVALKAHLKQKRKDKEPYITHPLTVANIIADLKLDEISIASALLHDVVEDSHITIEYIEKEFGKEIAKIVDGVTKITRMSSDEVDKEKIKAETFKKIILAMTDDVRVILIKLADRLHNVITLEPFRGEKRTRIAKETIEIYAPIAYRLGMGRMKDMLEDLSFPYAYPEEFKDIEKEINKRKEWAEGKLRKLESELKILLEEKGIKGKISFRIKRPISIYRKLIRQNISFDRVFDLLALRIITDSIDNCYMLLALINQKWKYMESRIRDFIQKPKDNGYRSLHTTIIDEDGDKFEIQIRTKEMHEIAEQGIAAHWKYKEGIRFLDDDIRLKWFRDMIEFHKNNPDPKEFMHLVKKELVPDEISVFTPKLKVINLKYDSSVIDFAYAIHTDIGNKCHQAIVNEHIVPIRTKLKTGDIVEIITSKNANPSVDWLKYVVTEKAKKNINSYIQKQENLKNIQKGKKIWAKFFRELKKKFKDKINELNIEDRIKRLKYTELNTFFKDLGSGKRTLDSIAIKKLFPEIDIKGVVRVVKKKERKSFFHKLIKVEGYDDIDVVFARCCSPIKGDDIVGFITKNRGIVIHKRSCTNIRNALESRLINVEWNNTKEYKYAVKYDLIVKNIPGMLKRISEVTEKFNSNILSVETTQISPSTTRIRIVFEVIDVSQLEKIHKKFIDIKGVFNVNKKRISAKEI